MELRVICRRCGSNISEIRDLKQLEQDLKPSKNACLTDFSHGFVIELVSV